ncbi:hypothetical protein DPEC_G00236150 [Dallia pectoralis]|uniref:Uncharacterized protein n=1 Tax=Dallia pectoralis TaxID=75939 RepID=A0ACC2FYG4_DALPE|nr:hypothetical protein DPEC_G00236150 [Dallia pectoralis]
MAMKKLTAKVSPSSPLTDLPDIRTPTLQEDVERQHGCRVCYARCALRAVRRAVWGLLLGCCVALAWAGATHYAKQSLGKFPAPFFMTWFCGSWNIFLFPLYYLVHALGALEWPWPGPRAHFRQCSGFLVAENITVTGLLKSAAPFSVLLSFSGYLYLQALRRISAGDASAVLCCSQAFVFLLSWIGLNDRFMGVRIVAVILSITGIVMMAYADGFHSDSITGVALGVGSASTAAFYKVLLRKRMGEVQPGEASVLLSCVGLCTCVLHSWVCVLLYLTHLEYWPPTQSIPWDTLSMVAILLLAFSVLVNLGSVIASPVLISLGMLLSIPANTAVDFYVAAARPISQVRMSAVGVIGMGYLLLLLPEDWDNSIFHQIEGLCMAG